MTEQEAKTKVCPLMQPNMGDGYCLVSSCMMWRWELPIEQADCSNEEQWDRGYCGLGGKP